MNKKEIQLKRLTIGMNALTTAIIALESDYFVSYLEYLVYFLNDRIKEINIDIKLLDGDTKCGIEWMNWKMNDFTKEELESIANWGDVYTEFGNSWADKSEMPLINKIQYMINNYCDHKLIYGCCNCAGLQGIECIICDKSF